jgi:hypothetical protein
MQTVPLSVALVAGALVALNPCSLPLLPPFLAYYHQRRALTAVGSDATPISEDFETSLRRWHEEHADIHPLTELRRELDARFTQRYCGWVPYLLDYALEDLLEPVERGLIESGAIAATGFRYIGERSSRGSPT